MRIISIIWLLIINLSVFSQSITGRINRSTVSVGDNFQVTFDIEGDGSNFSAPSFENFGVLSGPNKSSSMQWVNGEFSSSLSYSYILKAMNEGEFSIEPASVKFKSNVVQSQSIKVRVLPSRQQSSAQSSTATQSKPNPQVTSKESKEDLFLKLYVDKKQVFVGEQIIATYLLYMNTQIVNYASSRPVFNGFYAQELEVDPSGSLVNETINGKQYTVATMKKVVLTPQKSGEITVPSLDMEMVIRVAEKQKRRSMFDQFFGSFKNVKVEVKSNEEKINVSRLPTQGQPRDFIGAVGEFKLNTTLDRTEVGVNEAINLTVNISGNGNLELISLPKIEFPNDFETYDPKTKQDISVTAAGTKGKRTFEYVLIPRFAGEFKLKPVSFSYFDPKTKSYKQLSSESITLNVLRTDGESLSSGGAHLAPKKENVQIIGKDIRFIKTDEPELKRKESGFYRSTLFYALSTLPFVGMGASIFLFGFFRTQNSDLNALKSKRAGGIAKKHLAKATKLLNGENEPFYDAISLALFGYISDKLVIPFSELNREKIEETLQSKKVSSDTKEKLKKALDECEMVRFAPGIIRGKEEMLSASKQIIEELEDEL
ncbi:BatD family protein [Salibacteraceae bacterium]|nr:BatD family protein [Salibacteraceae bacterium]